MYLNGRSQPKRMRQTENNHQVVPRLPCLHGSDALAVPRSIGGRVWEPYTSLVGASCLPRSQHVAMNMNANFQLWRRIMMADLSPSSHGPLDLTSIEKPEHVPVDQGSNETTLQEPPLCLRPSRERTWPPGLLDMVRTLRLEKSTICIYVFDIRILCKYMYNS